MGWVTLDGESGCQSPSCGRFPCASTSSGRAENLGNKNTETVIRAEIPGTVLIRGDVPVRDWEKVNGYRFVYAADFDQTPYAVAEVDTLKLMPEALHMSELEFMPGSYFHDAEQGRLYISSTTLQPPQRHHYRVSVVPEQGFHLINPALVRVEGLAATGFNYNQSTSNRDGYGNKWGILLEDAFNCVIRHCTAFLNGGGISILRSSTVEGQTGNVIEDCRAYGNYSRFNVEGGNIVISRRGADPVVLTGDWALDDTSNVQLRRLTFTGSVRLGGGRGLS